MTDLISRRLPPTRTGAAGPPPPRSLSVSAAIGGAVAAGVSLVLCMSLALAGWFLADGGAHGNTTDALRVGADAWLVGLGSRITVDGLPLGMVPLTLTLVLVVVAFRTGRWVTRDAPDVDDDRALVGAIATFVCSYIVITVVTGVLAGQSGAAPNLSRAVVGAALVGVLGGGCGLATGTDRLRALAEQVPGWLRELVAGAIGSALFLLAAGAALVGVSLLASFNAAGTVLSGLHLGAGDALAYTVVMILVAPNAALFGSAYLIGPGFAVGAGTTVSASSVTLGAVPAVPLLAALPEQGPTPGWLMLLLGVPVLAAAWGITRARAGAEPLPYDIAAIRGAGAGLAGSALITLAVALAGGPMGTGRLAEVGAPVAEVFVFASGLMCLGGLLGSVAQTWWQRRR